MKEQVKQIYKIPMVSEDENMRVMEHLVENWHLGPENASEEPKANKEFWSSYADVMDVSEPEARRMLCANCEYFDNTPKMMKAMESVPFNEYDADGGGRGYCHKFDFICHNLRTCQAWEPKEYDMEDDYEM